MQRRVVHLAVVLGVVLGVCGRIRPAHAEWPGSTEATVFGGWHHKSSNSELGNGYQPNDVLGSAVALGMRAQYAALGHFGLEGELKYVLSSLDSNGDSAPILGLRGFGVYNILASGRVRPFVRLGFGTETLSSNSKRLDAPSDADSALLGGVGTRLGLSKRLLLRLDVTALLVPGRDLQKEVELEGTLGVGWLFGVPDIDSDQDGLLDENDRCPQQAEDKDGYQDTDGCIDPDNDGDGIKDPLDLCPNQAEVKNGIQDDDGCPDSDRDGDGIEDMLDRCPEKPENKNGFQDQDGCPDTLDTDKDGFADDKDKCPKEKENINGYMDDDGCPDTAPDTDGDAVDDLHDKCPKEKETVNSYQDDDGCPDVIPVKLKKYAGAIRGIEFETGSAKILAKSFKLLDAAAAVLTEFKDTRVEIGGHTDDVGHIEMNKTLSLERADSVKAYLTSKGIDAARIQTVGYGPDKPVAPNKTKAGRAKNRRIEFKLL